jgi:formate hydrogenlyase subunit 6/NADH:ubiquinone oxidoreductase subunit I/flavodoxin
MKKVIYYFSGTGNSMRAAYRIAAALTDTEIISMRCDLCEYSATNADIIGFVFPVYYWTMPETAVRFVKNLQINPNAYIFAISTAAGINGHSFEVLDEILKEKGTTLSYGKILYSVGNAMVSYPPMPFPKLWVPKMEKNLTAISVDITRMKTRKYPKASALTRIMYPSAVKYINALHEADKGFVVTDKCVSCGTCARVCPCKNIVMENGKPSFKHRCNFCMSCVAYCPVWAINYGVSPELKEKQNDFLFKNGKLTSKRKRYHNPFVSASDISTNRKYIK